MKCDVCKDSGCRRCRALSPRAQARWAEMQDRLYPDQETLERRIGLALGAGMRPEYLRAELERLGWRELAGGRWLHDLSEPPRIMVAALGAAYLGRLQLQPALWAKVLTFTRDTGARTITDAPICDGRATRTCAAMEPATLARVAGALLSALDTMHPRTPWAPTPPIKRHLESLARMALPPADPPVEITSPIPRSYLDAHGTAAE